MNSKKLMYKMYENDINAYIGLNYSHMGYWEGEHTGDDFQQAQEYYLTKLFEPLEINAQQTILDIGGGQGETAIWLHKKYGCKVVVVDIVQEMIDAGVKKVSAQKLEGAISFYCCDFLQFDSAEKFDHIVSVEAIHHIKDTESLFNACFNLLKPNGSLSSSTYVAHFRPKWLLAQYLLLTVGDKNLPTLQDYTSSTRLAGFSDIEIQDMSSSVLPKSSQVLRQEPYWSRIRDYHEKFYGKISNWVMPLFLKVHQRVLRRNQLQVLFINLRKPEL